MASSSRPLVLNLYKVLLRESQKFNSYNYRTYAVRRVRDAFREKKDVDDTREIQSLIHRAKENLEVIQRQVTIGQLYTADKLIIETSGNQ